MSSGKYKLKLRDTTTLLLKWPKSRGTWVAQSVKHLILDFSSDHDLTVCEFKPHTGLCADSVQPAWDSLCLSAPPPLKIN